MMAECSRIDFLILLKWAAIEPSQTRGAAYAVRMAMASASIDKIIQWLSEKGKSDTSIEIGEPSAFGIVSLRCSEEIVKLLEDCPEIAAILNPAGLFFEYLGKHTKVII